MNPATIFTEEAVANAKLPQPIFKRLTLVYSCDPDAKQMGGAVGYMQFLFREARKNRLHVRFIGVNLNEKSRRKGYDFVPIRKGTDSWQRFLLALFFKAPFLQFGENEIVHVFRIAYAFPILLFHPRTKVVCVTAEPLAAAAHRYPGWLFKIVEMLFGVVERFVLSRIRVLCTCDEILNTYFRRKYPRIIARLPIFPSTASGIDTELFRPMERLSLREKHRISPMEKVLLFVGRVAPVKRVDFLINVFEAFRKKYPQSRLLIVGRGESLSRVKVLVNEKQLEAVEFLGERSPQEVAEIYNIADVLLLASETEGNPTVVREALACGLPVVSTPVGDVPRLIGNSLMGKVVHQTNVTAFLTAIEELVEKDRNECMTECRKYAERFSNEAIFREMFCMYNRIGQGD